MNPKTKVIALIITLVAIFALAQYLYGLDGLIFCLVVTACCCWLSLGKR